MSKKRKKQDKPNSELEEIVNNMKRFIDDINHLNSFEFDINSGANKLSDKTEKSENATASTPFRHRKQTDLNSFCKKEEYPLRCSREKKSNSRSKDYNILSPQNVRKKQFSGAADSEKNTGHNKVILDIVDTKKNNGKLNWRKYSSYYKKINLNFDNRSKDGMELSKNRMRSYYESVKSTVKNPQSKENNAKELQKNIGNNFSPIQVEDPYATFIANDQKSTTTSQNVIDIIECTPDVNSFDADKLSKKIKAESAINSTLFRDCKQSDLNSFCKKEKYSLRPLHSREKKSNSRSNDYSILLPQNVRKKQFNSAADSEKNTGHNEVILDIVNTKKNNGKLNGKTYPYYKKLNLNFDNSGKGDCELLSNLAYFHRIHSAELRDNIDNNFIQNKSKLESDSNNFSPIQVEESYITRIFNHQESTTNSQNLIVNVECTPDVNTFALCSISKDDISPNLSINNSSVEIFNSSGFKKFIDSPTLPNSVHNLKSENVDNFGLFDSVSAPSEQPSHSICPVSPKRDLVSNDLLVVYDKRDFASSFSHMDSHTNFHAINQPVHLVSCENNVTDIQDMFAFKNKFFT